MGCKGKKKKPRRWMVLLPFLILLPSCALMQKVEDLTAELRVTVKELRADYQEAKDLMAAAKAEADTNKDGKTDSSEWITWATGGGLMTLVLGIIKIFSLQRQTDELYDKTHTSNADTAAATKLATAAAAHK